MTTRCSSSSEDGATKFCTDDSPTENVDAQPVCRPRQADRFRHWRRSGRSAPSAQVIPADRHNGGVSAAPPACGQANDYFDLLSKLETADISACVRQQPACAIDSDGSVFPMFDEGLNVSILDPGQGRWAPDVHTVTDPLAVPAI